MVLADAACAFNLISNVMMNGICCYYQHESKKTEEERIRTTIHNEYSVAVQHYKDRITQLEHERLLHLQERQQLPEPEQVQHLHRRHREQRQCHNSVAVLVSDDDIQRRTQLMLAKQQALQEQQQHRNSSHQPSSIQPCPCRPAQQRPSPLPHDVDSLLSVHSLSLEEVESYESGQFVQ